MLLAVSSTYSRSGSRLSFSGVGTQINIASASANRCMSAVGSNRPPVEAFADPRGGNVLDVAFARLQTIDFPLIDVEPQRPIAGGDKRPYQRQADVSQADHADTGRLLANGRFE